MQDFNALLMHFDTPIPRITLFPIYPQTISRYPLLGYIPPASVTTAASTQAKTAEVFYVF